MNKKQVAKTLLCVLILAGCTNTIATIAPSATGTPTTVLQPTAAQIGSLGYGEAIAAAWSQDGRLLGVAGSLGIHLYDTTTWRQVRFIETGGSNFGADATKLQFDLGNGDLYYMLTRDERQIFRYDISSGKSERLYPGVEFSNSTAIFFSGAGTLFAGIRREKQQPYYTMEIWDTASGKSIQSLDLGVLSWGHVFQVAFSPDEKLVAVGGTDNLAHVWDITNGKLLYTIEHEAEIQHLVFSPDGSMLVTAGNDAAVRFWDARSGDNLYVLKKFTHELIYLAYESEGQNLLIGLSDNSIEEWAVDGKYLPVKKKDSFLPDIPQYTNWEIVKKVPDPGGNRIALIVNSNLQVYDLDTKECLATLPEFNGTINDVKFSPDGSLLAVLDKNVHLWQMEAHTALGMLLINQQDVTDAAFRPGNSQIAVAASTIQVWDVGTLEKIWDAGEFAGKVAYSPDGTMLAGGRWNSVVVWGADDGEPILQIETDVGIPYSLTFSADGSNLTFVGQEGFRKWEIPSGTILESLDITEDANSDLYRTGIVTEMRQWIECGDREEILTADINLAAQVSMMGFPVCGKRNVAIHPSGRLLAVSQFLSNNATSVILKDITSGTSLTYFGEYPWLHSLKFSPDENILAVVGGYPNAVYLWDVSSTAQFVSMLPLQTVTPHPSATPTATGTPPVAQIPLPLATPREPASNAITAGTVGDLKNMVWGRGDLPLDSLTWSVDGSQFAVGVLGGVYLYKTGEENAWLHFQQNGVRQMAFSQHSRFLAAHTYQDEVIVWDLVQKKRIRSLENTCYPSRIFFSDDEQNLAIECLGEEMLLFDTSSWQMVGRKAVGEFQETNADGTLAFTISSYRAHLRDAVSGEILKTFESDGLPQIHGAFSPDGTTLAIIRYGVPVRGMSVGMEELVSYENTIELWRVCHGETPVLLHTLRKEAKSVEILPYYDETFAFTSDGKFLITALWNGYTYIWNVESGELLRTLADGLRVFLSPDNRFLMKVNSNGRIELWDINSPRTPVLRQAVTDFENKSLISRPYYVNVVDGAVIGFRDHIERLNLSGETVTTYELEKLTWEFAASPDGAFWATSNPDGSIAIRSSRDGQILWTLHSLLPSQNTEFIGQMVFSSYNNLLAVMDNRDMQSVWIWNARQARRVCQMQLDFYVGDMVFNPDGQLLAVSEYYDGTVEIWDARTCNMLRRFDFAGEQISFTPDGMTLVTAWDNGRIWLLDIRSGATLGSIQTGGVLYDIEHSPVSDLLVVSTQHGLEFWDPVTSRKLHTIEEAAYYSSLKFSPDGSILTGQGTIGSRISVWSVDSK